MPIALSYEIEQMRWALLRSHRERAAPARWMVSMEQPDRHALQLTERARDFEEEAEIAQRRIGERSAGAQPNPD
jgi:hypothetical protein